VTPVSVSVNTRIIGRMIEVARTGFKSQTRRMSHWSKLFVADIRFDPWRDDSESERLLNHVFGGVPLSLLCHSSLQINSFN
jgi:hypothetical protein